MQLFKNSCCWILAIEGLFAGLTWEAYHNSEVALNLLPFILIGLMLNLPGSALAHGLGLLGNPGANSPSPHPVAGLIVSFVVGTLCWVALVWFASGRPIPGAVEKGSPSQDQRNDSASPR